MCVELNRILDVSRHEFEQLPPPPFGHIYYITNETANKLFYRCERPIRKEVHQGVTHLYTDRLHLQNIAELTSSLAQKVFEIFEDERIRASYDAPADAVEREQMFRKWVAKKELFVITKDETFIGFVFAGVIQGGKGVEISAALHPSQIKKWAEYPSSNQGFGEEAIHAIVNAYIPFTPAEKITAFTSFGTPLERIIRKLGFSLKEEIEYTRAASPQFPYPII